MNSAAKARLSVVAVLLAVLLGGGCSGLMLLASYLGVASSILSIIDNNNDPSNPTYKLQGYVYLDEAAGKIAISNTQTPPSGGSYHLYTGAPLSIDTIPLQSRTADAQGFFSFSGIRETRVVLTVVAPDATLVKFNVRLDSPSIEPQ